MKEFKGINRINDYAFKRIFGSKESKDILLGFLNDVLQPPPGREIVDLTLDGRELNPEFVMERGARIDILAKTSQGILVNVEVQVANEFDIDRRTLFHWARLYQGQLTEGQKYAELCQTITINIIAFDWFTDDRRPHHSFHVRDDETGKVFCDQLEIHFLELKKARDLQHPPQTALEEWLVYLNNVEGEEMDAIAERNPAIRKALTMEEIFWKDQEERRRYEMRQKYLRDEISGMAGAEARGEARGEVKGSQEAICKFLDVRFGDASQGLQGIVRRIDKPEILNKIINGIYAAGSLEEAGAVVDGAAN